MLLIGTGQTLQIYMHNFPLFRRIQCYRETQRELGDRCNGSVYLCTTTDDVGFGAELEHKRVIPDLWCVLLMRYLH